MRLLVAAVTGAALTFAAYRMGVSHGKRSWKDVGLVYPAGHDSSVTLYPIGQIPPMRYSDRYQFPADALAGSDTTEVFEFARADTVRDSVYISWGLRKGRPL